MYLRWRYHFAYVWVILSYSQWKSIWADGCSEDTSWMTLTDQSSETCGGVNKSTSILAKGYIFSFDSIQCATPSPSSWHHHDSCVYLLRRSLLPRRWRHPKPCSPWQQKCWAAALRSCTSWAAYIPAHRLSNRGRAQDKQNIKRTISKKKQTKKNLHTSPWKKTQTESGSRRLL